MSNKIDFQFVHVPGGPFFMGSKLSSDPKATDDEMPYHELDVTDFYIMRFPVTNAQYQQFIEATGYRAPLFWKEGRFPVEQADHPVVGVSFQDTATFCRWAKEISGLAIRLPSEPEWEKAARGADGRIYPWGDQWESKFANTYELKIGATTPVGKFSPEGDSPYGVAEMAGNVQQWTASLFDQYPYNPDDGREIYVYNLDSSTLLPKFHDTGGTMIVTSGEAATGKTVLRGGSWRETYQISRCAYRGWAPPMHRSDDTGFRCCYEP